MNVRGDQAFIRWTQAAGRWSTWIKPSLFAPAYWADGEVAETLPKVGWLPPPNETALVIDLPGVEAVRLGIALDHAGYSPVPMFNTTLGFDELVAATSVADAMLLESTRLGARAAGPPAFLLDSTRTAQGKEPWAGAYDNRWYVFSSDFPTEQALKAAGVRKLLVVCQNVLPDLHDALARHGGLELEVVDPKTERRSRFPRPRWIALRALSSLSHHSAQNDLGTFGYAPPKETPDPPKPIQWNSSGGSSGG